MMVTSRESAWACTQKRDRLRVDLSRLVSWIKQSRIDQEESNQNSYYITRLSADDMLAMLLVQSRSTTERDTGAETGLY